MRCNLRPTSPRTSDSPPDTGETQRGDRGCNAQGLASCRGISGRWGQRRQRANKRPALTACSLSHAPQKWRGQSNVSVARCRILVGLFGELNAAGCDLYSSGRPSILRGQRGARFFRCSGCSRSSNERSSRIGTHTLAEYRMGVSFFSPNRFDADD